MEGPAERPAASGGRLLNRPAAAVPTGRPLVRSAAPSPVPATCGAPLLPGCCADGAAAACGARAAVRSRSPGHTNASSSSAASSPAPAAAAG